MEFGKKLGLLFCPKYNGILGYVQYDQKITEKNTNDKIPFLLKINNNYARYIL